MTGKPYKTSTTPKANFFKGHSDSKVEFIGDKVKKSASNFGGHRLMKQMHKMVHFARLYLDSNTVDVPLVLETDGKTFYTMEKIEGLDFYTRIHEVDSSISQTTADKILSFLVNQNNRAVPGEIPNSVIMNKVEEMSCNRRGQAYVRQIFKNKALRTNVGPHHGDFSLANMMFLYDGRMSLFDMSDDICEAPIFDAIKMRLDVVHHWTLFYNGLKFTKEYEFFSMYVRERIDTMLVTYYKLSPSEISALTCLWLMRILKHARTEDTINFLLKAIREESECPRLYCPPPERALASRT